MCRLLCCLLCWQRLLRGADHSFREILHGVFVCLIVCDIETSKLKGRRSAWGCCATGKQNKTKCIVSLEEVWRHVHNTKE